MYIENGVIGFTEYSVFWAIVADKGYKESMGFFAGLSSASKGCAIERSRDYKFLLTKQSLLIG